MSSELPRNMSGDMDMAVLVRAISRHWLKIAVLALGAGILSFLYLNQLEPVYTAEARILIGGGDSVYRRPADAQAPGDAATRLDREAIGSQVAVLYSDDLAHEVARKLELHRLRDFNPALQSIGFFKHLAIMAGLVSDPFAMPERERVLRRFQEGLTVYQVPDTRVVVVSYEAHDPKLAARIANSLAAAYLDWQRRERLQQTRAASAWLSQQIRQMREKLARSEAAVEAYRLKHGLYEGSNNVELSAQQLSELNSQLILAKATRTEAEARARSIRDILRKGGRLESVSDVVKSPFIQRLIEQQVSVQRRLAQLSATHLRSHPRIKRLRSELAGLRRQIRTQAAKIIAGLENEAAIAGAREASLNESLNALKKQKGGRSAALIRLRELEREAKANRDVLATFLARQGDASTRLDLDAVVPGATIYSRATPSSVPSFPKKLPIIALTMLATAMVSLFVVITKALMDAGTMATPRKGASEGEKTREEVRAPAAGNSVPGRRKNAGPPSAGPRTPASVPPHLAPVRAKIETPPAPSSEVLPEFGKRN